VELIQRESESLGLHLNHSKCEVISRSDTSTKFNNLKNFKPVNPKAPSLLGSLLSDSEALEQTLESHCKSLSLAITRLGGIGRHDTLILLRNSLSHPKLLHTLRCCPCVDHSLLKVFDSLLWTGLEIVLNLSLADSHWAQASLPVKAGGLGIRLATLLALPAFLASAAGTCCLQSTMLGGLQIPDDEQYVTLRYRWCTEYSSPCPDDISAHKQSVWDKPIIHRETSSLIDSFSQDYDKARFRSVVALHSSNWLLALPITTCGLRLDNEAVRVAMGLRLGVNICEPHECRCGTMVKANGSHGLSCSLGPGRAARHAKLNELICMSLVRAGIPATKEPTDLSRTDGKRPDDLKLIPWWMGRALFLDATVADTLAASYLPSLLVAAAATAEQAADRKCAKYDVLSKTYHFLPVACETLGLINNSGHLFIAELGRCLSRLTGDMRKTSHLYQRISITIQRFDYCFPRFFCIAGSCRGLGLLCLNVSQNYFV